MTTPFGGYPDELDHYYRALSLGRGELVGGSSPVAPETAEPAEKSCCELGSPTAIHWVHLGGRAVDVARPRWIDFMPCQVTLDNARYSCKEQLSATPEQIVARTSGRVTTLMGTVEPAGYIVPGLAGLLFENAWTSARLARLGGAFVVWVALGSALLACLNRREPDLGYLALLISVSPMVVFVGSSSSPNGAEVAGAVAFCAGFWNLGRGRPTRSAVVAATLGGLLLAMSRSLGPIWLVLAAALLMPFWDDGALRTHLAQRRRASIVWASVIGTACLSTASWELFVQPHVSWDASFFIDSVGPAARDIPRIMNETVGVFGSLDVVAPKWIRVAWWASTVALVVAALIGGRIRVVVLAAASCYVAGIVLIGAGVIRQHGFGLQGRHVLPLFVIAVFVAAASLEAGKRTLALPYWSMPVLTAAWATVHVVSVRFNMDTYSSQPERLQATLAPQQFKALVHGNMWTGVTVVAAAVSVLAISWISWTTRRAGAPG